MLKGNQIGGTLDFLLCGTDGRPDGWSASHVEFLRMQWNNIDPRHMEYNKAYSAVILAKRPTAEVQFIADANIPHLSKWARKELAER